MKVRHRQTFYAMSLVVGDFFLILAALRFAFWLKFESGLLYSPHGIPDIHIYSTSFPVAGLLMIYLFRMYGLYIEEKIARVTDELYSVVKAVTVAALLLLSTTFFIRDISFSRGYFPIAWVAVVFFVMIHRTVLSLLYTLYRRQTGKVKDVLMIGANPNSVKYAVRHARQPRLLTRVVGLLDERYPALTHYKGYPVLGHPKDLESILVSHAHLNEVIVTAGNLMHSEVIRILTLCEKYLVAFKWVPDILGLVATQMRVKHEGGLPLLSFKEIPLSEWENRLLKRAVDVFLCGLGLLVLAPVYVVVALAVKMDSRGPCFYRQERVGEDGRTFLLYKFRTMLPDAERETGPVWASKNDDRRTRIGGFLRQTNLDELPQLWNVLKGDMSLVGPRPERPHFVGQFREDIPRYMGRHWIKSGITGWAQVNGLRGNTSIEERTKYDLFYIENWSLFLDLKILFMTLFAFKNAY